MFKIVGDCCVGDSDKFSDEEVHGHCIVYLYGKMPGE